jgi:hypothetical protein
VEVALKPPSCSRHNLSTSQPVVPKGEKATTIVEVGADLPAAAEEASTERRQQIRRKMDPHGRAMDPHQRRVDPAAVATMVAAKIKLGFASLGASGKKPHRHRPCGCTGFRGMGVQVWVGGAGGRATPCMWSRRSVTQAHLTT